MPRPDRFRMKIYLLFDGLEEAGKIQMQAAIDQAMDWCDLREEEAVNAFAYWVIFKYKRKVEEAKPKPVKKLEEEKETYGFKGWAPPGWMTCPTCKGQGVLGDRNDHTTWKRCPTCDCKEIVKDPNYKKEGGGESEEPKG